MSAMSVKADLRAYAGNNVLLPGSQVPRPATILVSAKTGKIIDVREGRRVRADYADIAPGVDDLHWVDVGDKYYLLPGLVEYVGPPDCPATSCAIVKPLLFPPTSTLLLLCVQCACAPQRAWADGLGGLRDGHARRGVRGYHHRRGHAAQLDPPYDHGGEPRGQTQRRARAVLDRRCVLGRRHPRQSSARTSMPIYIRW
jgi:hypothetical protein